MQKLATKPPQTSGTKPIADDESDHTHQVPAITLKKENLYYLTRRTSQWLLKKTIGTSTIELFKQFKLGAMLFFLGLVIIYGAYQLLEHSLSQEIATLIGLALIGIGFFLAMLAQLRMLIGRLIHIFFHKSL